MGRLIILQTRSASVADITSSRTYSYKQIGCYKTKTPLKLSHLLCLAPLRVSVRKAGSAGLRKGLQGVVMVTIRDKGAARPLIAL